jgi:hypothetical protein
MPHVVEAPVVGPQQRAAIDGTFVRALALADPVVKRKIEVHLNLVPWLSPPIKR